MVFRLLQAAFPVFISIDVARQILEEDAHEKQRMFLDSMREEIEGMDALIDRILRLSRLDLNESEPMPLCFVEILNDSLRRHADSFHAKNIHLVTNLPPNLPGVGVTEDIACLIENLLSNALKFTEAGGNAKLSLHSQKI